MTGPPDEHPDTAATLDDAELDTVAGGAGESRYGNQETGYLLKRLETHKGLVTLTSNLSGTPTAEGTKDSTKP